MEKLDFVKLACSKDPVRFNLNSVYRDTEHFVATDGHRMHYANGLPKIEKGHYIDGLDADFPNWQMLIPTKSPQCSFKLTVGKELIQRLKALHTLAVTINKLYPPCRFSIIEDTLSIATEQKDKLSIQLLTPALDIDGIRFSPVTGLNSKFILDVFESAFKQSVPITIKYYGDEHPWIFDVPRLGTALIMPLRLKD